MQIEADVKEYGPQIIALRTELLGPATWQTMDDVAEFGSRMEALLGQLSDEQKVTGHADVGAGLWPSDKVDAIRQAGPARST